MHKDTIIYSGYISYLEGGDLVPLYMKKSISRVLRTEMNKYIHEEDYIDFLDVGKEPRVEYGDVVSIRSSDTLSKSIIEGGLPFYVHAREPIFNSVTDSLLESVNNDIVRYTDKVDDLVVIAKIHYTEFDGHFPLVSRAEGIIRFKYDKKGNQYKLKRNVVYAYPLMENSLVDKLSAATDIFSFSVESYSDFSPIINLLDSIMKHPEPIQKEYLNSELEREIAKKVLNVSMNPFTEDKTSLVDIMDIFKDNTDISIAIGAKNAINYYKKVVPIIVKNIMHGGQIKS